MYVAITGRGKAKVVQFCEQHRIPGTKKKKTIVLRTLGNYEKMLEENPNIITELKEKAKVLTNLEKKKKQEISTSLFRFGHSLVKKLWERSEEHTSELQSRQYLVCRLLLEKKNSK